MNLNFKQRSPMLIYNGEDIKKQIDEIKALQDSLNDEGKKKATVELKYLVSGLYGENAILYELLNSNIPMYIFHDVYYEYENKSAQIDFLIITDYKIFVIEAKNMIGNIIVNDVGNFIKVVGDKKEGMYSPVTQNDRHVRLLINLLISRQKKLKQYIYKKILPDMFVSVVVFTNAKTIINKSYAPIDIKSRVIKADEVITFIKRNIEKQEKNPKGFTNSLVNFFNYYNKINDINYTQKYNQYITASNEEKEILEEKNHDLKNRLIKYRIDTAKNAEIKPFYIFTNEQLNELVIRKPKDKNELLNIKGFGEYKVNLYGEDIIKIINQ